jgi:hypothetical protein
MSQRPKLQIDTIDETRWQLEAAVGLARRLMCDEHYRDLPEHMDATLISATAYLMAHNYQRLSEKEKAVAPTTA